MAKDNFIFYREWFNAIRELEPAEQLQSYDAIMRFVFEGVEPSDKYIRAVTAMMRSTIIRDREKYERVCERNRTNGIKGGRPRKTETQKTEPNPKNPMGFEKQSEQSTAEHDDKPTPEHRTAIEQQFEDFRVAYPGSKRGFAAEFDNFKRKNKTAWRDIVPLLMPALNRLIEWRERAAAAGQFVPNYKNLQTWLNKQCWTEELPEIKVTPIIPKTNATTASNIGYPKTDAVRQREFAEHIIDKLNRPNAPEPDISGNY